MGLNLSVAQKASTCLNFAFYVVVVVVVVATVIAPYSRIKRHKEKNKTNE